MKFFRVYVVPGLVFQSITIGGGYGTGREIVEYFTRFGVMAGIAGMAVTTLCVAAIVGATFEFARRFAVYDYRSFMRALVGRAAIGYEILAIVMLLLVLAVVGSAAGNVLADTFGISVWWGGMLMLLLVMVLNFFGRSLVSGALSAWAVLLTIVFGVICFLSLSRFGEGLRLVPGEADFVDGWLSSAMKFALYNVAAVPMMLWAIRDIEKRSQAFASGAIAAMLMIIPGLMFHLAFATSYPEVTGQTLPTYWMIERFAMPVLMGIYVIVLFGTLIETCAGIMQGVNERIDHWYFNATGRHLSRVYQAALSGGAIVASAALSTFGIVTLIARGYGTLAWCFLAVYVVPVLTIGVWKILGTRRSQDPQTCR